MAVSPAARLAVVVLSLGLRHAAEVARAAPPDAPYSDPVAVCEVTDPRIREASGLAASRRHPGLLYVHNDSGNPPHVYVLDRGGRVRATIELDGARNVDWEDIALAPSEHPERFDVCIADIGDNQARRREIVIYRFAEPELPAAAGAPASQPNGAAAPPSGPAPQGTKGRSAASLPRSAPGELALRIRPSAYRFRYEDGAHDAEGFAVHPRTGDGYVFIKQPDGRGRVYRIAAPWDDQQTTTLKSVAALRFPETLPVAKVVTAADISPDGRRLAMRSYACGWEWELPDELTADELARILTTEPRRIRLAAELQGEAICYSADGGAILTVGEHTPTMLFEVRRQTGPIKP